MAQHYLVTKSNLGGDNETFFDSFHDAVGELAKEGIEVDATDRREGSTQIRVVYSDPERRLRVTLWDDYIAETRYLEISSDDEALASKAKKAFEQHLDIETLTALLARARKEMEKNPKVLARLAYAAPVGFDETCFDVIRVAINDGKPDIRRYAAYAAGVIGWREFVPVLEARLAEELPGEVKSYIETALRLCRGGK